MQRSNRRRRRGFTLMEVLLVLAILVILGSFVTVGYIQLQKNANKDATKSQISMLESAIEHYELNVGRLPSDLDGLRNLPADLKNPAKWSGPYIKGELPKDAWGNDFHYEVTDEKTSTFRIWSDGPDQQGGSDDDISNDEPKT
ncbi:MAG: type II secretion system major pseudopilin GspG [Pirellulaceae bacterium]|nr:type II secretion system major pseudopilin GspG [Pirellulaceae bacterium]